LVNLSLAQARAIALAAQGLAVPRPGRTDANQLRALVDQLGVVQIDSVNVLVRSHYLPAFSRLGSYDTTLFDRHAHRAPRALFEYWGHEASLLPVALQPLFRWRMERAREHAWGRMKRIANKRPTFVQDVLALVRERGPIAASEIEPEMERAGLRPARGVAGRPSRKGWWEWSDAKTAIEWLFWSGQVTSAKRRGFERLYDLPERVLPAKILPHRRRTSTTRSARLSIAQRVHSASRAKPTCATTTGFRSQLRARRSPSSSKPARSSAPLSRAGRSLPTSTTARRSRNESTPTAQLCSRRSTRWYGFAIAPRGCSA
jgi:uncharacterized protein YcaQ